MFELKLLLICMFEIYWVVAQQQIAQVPIAGYGAPVPRYAPVPGLVRRLGVIGQPGIYPGPYAQQAALYGGLAGNQALYRGQAVYGQQAGLVGAGVPAVTGQGLSLNDIYARFGPNIGRVMAAVYSTRSIQAVDVPSQYQPPQPIIIDIEPNEQPLILNFGSRSSSIVPIQMHEGREGTVQRTQSVDQPHQLMHEVVRPIVQEVREVIQPERRIIQEITPIVENIQTLVARGEGGAPAPVVPNVGAIGVGYGEEDVRSAYLRGIGGPIGAYGLLGGAGLLGAPGLIGGAYGVRAPGYGYFNGGVVPGVGYAGGMAGTGTAGGIVPGVGGAAGIGTSSGLRPQARTPA